MKKREIIISLIILVVGIITLGMGWHRYKNASTTKPNLIKCMVHVDENLDMSCDKCGAVLSFKDIAKYQEIEDTTEAGTVIEVKGNMPKNTVISAKDIEKEKAVELAHKYIPQIENDEVLYAYNISMNTNKQKYQPKHYEESVNVDINNIEIKDKNVSLIHIINDDEYEIIKPESNTEKGLNFKATSFSSYIVVNVANYNVSFETPGNYKIYNEKGREIKTGTAVLENQNFTFVVEPKDGYGISEITASAGNLSIRGDILSKTVTIDSVTADTTINISTVNAPKIIKQPTNQKGKIGDQITFSIEAENVENYEWEYKRSGESEWNSIVEWGIDSSVESITVPIVEEIRDVEVRCVLENQNFRNKYAVISNEIKVIVAQGTLEEEIEKIDESKTMITEWTIPSANTEIKLPVRGTGLNVTVDWGDGTNVETVTTALPTHTYAEAGTYEIRVSGTCPEWGVSIRLGTTQYRSYEEYLTKVKQFGELNATRYGFSRCKNLTEVSGENLVTSKTFENVTNMSNMFYNCSNLTNLNLRGFDTSKVTDMSYMFYGCSKQINLDVSNFDTSNVTNMSYMFSGCNKLTNLDLSSFNTSKITNMSYMFYSCSNLVNLNLSGLDTSKVTNMSYMFYGCSNLENLDLSGLDTSKVTNMSYMFYECSNLDRLDVSNFDTSNVTNMSYMFSNCSKSRRIYVTDFDTSKVINMERMFYNCGLLIGLDISSFDTSNVTNMSYILNSCGSLLSLQLGNKFKIPNSNNSDMFARSWNFISIIIVDSTPLANQFASVKAQLDGKTIYVLSKEAEATYEEAWSADFSGDRIRPILELVGDENITINKGEIYTEPGVKIAGFAETNMMGYGPYGYNLTTSGEVDTANVGTYKIEYTLTRRYTNGTVTGEIMKATRTVEVVDMSAYMITEWTIPSGDTTIKLPVQGTGLNITVDWGDGTEVETVTTSFPTHIYADAGTYEIKIRGNCPKWGYSSYNVITETSDYYTYTQYLSKVKQLGELGATSYGFAHCKNLIEVSGENLVTSKTFEKTTSMARMFRDCSNLTSLDASKFNTSKVKSMSEMFYGCSNLTNLDVNGFDTSNVTSMDYMFSRCSKLTSLEVSSFNTTNVTSMICMFNSCRSLTGLDVSSFDTLNVTSMNAMFDGCSGLTSLSVNNFNTLKVTDMASMFSDCIRLTNLNLNNFDTSNVTNMRYMFSSCEGLTNLNISNFNTLKVKDMESMFSNCRSLTTLDASSFDTSNVTNMAYMFRECSNLTSLDVSSFYTPNVTNMSCMFSECSKLTSLNVNKFSTSKVRSMYHIFYNCSKLTSLNVSNFDTSSVTNMEGMFYNCSRLTSLNVSNFDTSSVTNMKSMFENCSNLTNLDVSNFDTSKVTNMFSTFVSCSRLTTLDVSKFNTSNVTDMTNMFYGCSNLTSLNVSNFDTSKVTSMDVMFYNCSKLTSLDVSNFDTSKITSMHGMFGNCRGLKSLQLSSKYKILTRSNDGIFANTTNLNSIIIIDTEPLASQFTAVVSQLNGKTIYVPSKDAEATYEEAWSGDFSGDRIKPILELVGNEKITINKGETYTEAGATVAGFTKANSGDYAVYGYNLTSSGEVDTTNAGTYKIEYTLTRTYENGTGTVTEEIMKATRTVEVVDTVAYMITEWTIPSANTTIKLPVQGTGLNITVDWGDGTEVETVTTAFPTHTYAEAGTYEIKVRGNCPVWGYASSSTVSTTSDYYTCTQYLTKVKQLGELNAIRYGFARCTNLIEVSGENLVTSKTFEKTTDMSFMFYGCSGLTNIDVSNFDTSNVTNMSSMLYGCRGLISIDVSGFDTSKVTDMSDMFSSCSGLTNIDVSNFDTSKVTNMRSMFSGCSGLINIDVSNFDTSKVTNMRSMFRGCSGLTNLDVSNFNTSNVTDMSDMFYECRSLTNLDVSKFDTSNVKSMSWMFRGCRGLTKLDVSGFDTSNVTDMSYMFSYCSGLTKLDVSKFNTSKVTDMRSMFYSCSRLTNLDVSEFDTSKVTSMAAMFSSCSGLTNLDVSGFNTSNVKNMNSMFNGCTNLKTLQLSSKFVIPTSNVTNMFTNTTNLKSIILIDTTPLASQFTSIKDQLDGKTIYVPSKDAEIAYEEAWSGDFSGDRIRSILELVGEEKTTINKGETYMEAGATVAGFTKANSEYYTPYGYDLTTSGEVDTATIGTYKIEYTLTRTYNNGTNTVTEEIMKATRTVEVVDTAAYMITEWTIPSGDTEIKLPVQGTGLNITVDWGDGTEVETVTTEFPTHIYAEAGTYEIKVRGNCPEWGYSSEWSISTSSNYYTYTQYLTKVKQLGELNAIRYGFARCTNLTEVSGENLVTSKTFEKVTDMSYMFYGCKNLIDLDVSSFDTSNVTDMQYMFNKCNNLTSLDVSGFDTSKVTNMRSMFNGCSGLTNLDVSNFDTSNVTSMYFMFGSCEKLTSLNVSNFNTSKVTDMWGMFLFCSSLTSLDVSNFDTSKVTSMGTMFDGCKSLTDLDVSNFDTSNVTRMDSMFMSCKKLTSLDVSNFDTSNVMNISGMFAGCGSLTSLDVSNFDTSKVTSMYFMFEACNSLTSLDVSNFDTSSVTNMSRIFSACGSLRSLQISNKFKILVTNSSDIFSNTTNLKSIILIDTTPLAGQFTSVKDQLEGKTIYVPSKDAKAAYEEAWSGDFSGDRIHPILELVGEEKITINKGETYTEAGATVAGFTKANSEYYTPYGYNLTSSGEVDTANAGTYKIEYTLTRTYENGTGTVTEEIMKATRTVEVVNTAAYMITEWTIPSANTTIKLPVQGTGLNIKVDWGDGTEVETVTTSFPTHIYAEAGTYEIKVRGNCPEWGYASSSTVSTTSDYYTYTQYLTKVKQFGELSATKYGFASCTNLIEVSGENIVTSKTFENVTNMAYMFSTCNSLTSLDVSEFDTSSVTSMDSMFAGCKQLSNLDVSNFNTSRVTNMRGMFNGCSNLVNLNLGNFDTSKVKAMTSMFNNCNKLINLDVSNFNTRYVTDMDSMFSNCSNLTNLNLSNFDTSKVTNMSSMFNGCSNLTNLNLSNFDTSKVTNMSSMFNGCSNLTNLNLSNFDTSKVKAMTGMFNNCNKLTNLNVSNFNTRYVTDMDSMFSNCSNLTSLDVTGFDTRRVTNMANMFFGCKKLSSLDLMGFDTSDVRDMSGMFSNCSSLNDLNLSGFNTSVVTSFDSMFYNCSNIYSLDLSNFDTRKVTSFDSMFSNCSSIYYLDLSRFDTIRLESVNNMFYDCTNLKSLQLSNKFVIPTSNVTNMFIGTSNLKAIIMVDKTPLKKQFTSVKDQLDGKAIYVPSKEAEEAYEVVWAGDFGADRIKPVLELVGEESVTVDVGSAAYTDAGYTVAGFTKDNSINYECYGYNVTSSGEVNTLVAGKYEITYTITRTYQKDGQTLTSEPYEVTREIIVLAVPLVKPTLVGTYTYNGLIQTAELKLTSENKFEILNNTRKDAGTQEIIIKIKDKNTYAWEDGTTDDVKIVWEIKPIIAEITWSATTIEYDGTPKQITATISNAVNGEVITVTEYEGTTTATEVGKYTAKVKSLSSTNYTLEGASNIEKEWQISVAVVEMTVIMKDYSYGGTLPTPSITNNTAGRRVTYYYSENDTNKNGIEWSTVKDSLSLSVGTYYMYAIVEANQNYEETITDPVAFKVLGTELEVVITKENKIEYDRKWSNQNIYIYITKNGNANVTAYQYKIGASGNWVNQVTSPVVLENNMNGEVTVRGVNPAGKVVTNEKSAGLIKIDKTMPNITNVSYKNENRKLSITATIDDSLSGIVAYAITPENGIREWIESTKGTKEAIVEGSGTYTVWAKDEAGNIAYKTIEAVRDVKAPVGTIIVKDAYTVENNIFYVNQKDVILQITATDDVSTSEQIKMAIYKEDAYNALNSEEDITWEQYEENKQWTLTKENADEKIYLILKDLAGNISVKVGE